MMELDFYEERHLGLSDIQSVSQLDPALVPAVQEIKTHGMIQALYDLYLVHHAHAYYHRCHLMAGSSVPARFARRWMMRSVREVQSQHPEIAWAHIL